jgi:serine protease AprX
VIDTGVAPVPGLDAPGKLIYGPDLSFDSQNPSTAYLDGYGHGTVMASLIGASDIGDGYQGVAPGARILSVRVGANNGAVDVSQIIAGIDWVVQHRNSDGLNVRVLNLSLGTDSLQPYQIDPLAHAAEVAWRHGIVVVAAVGNDGKANRDVADPATDPYLIAVGAEDPNGTVDSSDDTIPSFSSRGNQRRHADLVAPGVSILGLRVPGSALDTAFPNARIGDRFFRGSGTSQATALVSGAVADLLSQRPDMTPDQVKALLIKTAQALPQTSPKYSGAGVLSMTDALTTKTPKALNALQVWPLSDGSGTLEDARGSAHVAFGDNTLSGEQDIFGNRYRARAQGRLEESDSAWNGGVWNGTTWTGSNWASNSWAGSNWASNSWGGVNWSSSSWAGVNWSGVNWSSNSWAGSNWASSSWAGVNWSSSSWASSSWASSTWSSSSWASSTWSSSSWASSSWASSSWASSSWASSDWG